MNRREILDWLQQDDPQALADLWRLADGARRDHVGDQVHFRGLIEISNHCTQRCGYCGLRGPNRKLQRYRMTAAGILDCARQAIAFGYGTVVLQAGEDPGIETAWMRDLIGRIKALRTERPLPSGRGSPDGAEGVAPPAVTLSLGERGIDELAAWKAAGADRYLLRFETSNRTLFDRIHPPLPGKTSDRIALLRRLRELGYEIGSGVMIGIPGQTYADLADDILLLAELDLDMIGVGPYLPHPQTPLGRKQPATENTESTESDDNSSNRRSRNDSEARFADRQSSIVNRQSDQAPNTELMTYKVMSLARLACPDANIPSTTALATLNREHGRELGLARGANVVMPNLTPPQYRAMYEIYPAKACIYETADQCHLCLSGRIASIGRRAGAGRGDRSKMNRLT